MTCTPQGNPQCVTYVLYTSWIGPNYVPNVIKKIHITPTPDICQDLRRGSKRTYLGCQEVVSFSFWIFWPTLQRLFLGVGTKISLKNKKKTSLDLFSAHDSNRGVPGYGVSIGQNGVLSPISHNTNPDWKSYVEGWYSEVRHFTYGKGANNKDDTVGHFVQVGCIKEITLNSKLIFS